MKLEVNTVAAVPTDHLHALPELKTQVGCLSFHQEMLQTLHCFKAVLTTGSASHTSSPDQITVGYWNLDASADIEAVAQHVLQAGIDILLCSEIDIGVARSGFENHFSGLARRLRMQGVFFPEFIEINQCAPERSELGVGLHGNAIFSRVPLDGVEIQQLPYAGRWYAQNDGQAIRIGARNALYAKAKTLNTEVVLCVTHIENRCDAAERAAQMAYVLDHLFLRDRNTASIVGADLNCKAFYGDRVGWTEIFAPQTAAGIEPMFAHIHSSGFDWLQANTRDVSTRPKPGQVARYPATRLDWLLTRGLDVTDPGTIGALDNTGQFISDHDLIIAKATQMETQYA